MILLSWNLLDAVCEDPWFLHHSADAVLFTVWNLCMPYELRAGRDLPNLAEISLAAGLLASGSWNKKDSWPTGREWTQLLLSASLGDDSYPARPGPLLWMRSFSVSRKALPAWNPLLPLEALVQTTLHTDASSLKITTVN